MIRGEMHEINAASRQNRRPRGQALQAIAVERAHAGEIDVECVAARVNVADLRMHQAVQRRAIDEYAATDAGAHRQIDQVFCAASGAPAMLRQGGGVHVRVETHRAGELLRKRPDHIDVAPAGLGRFADEAVLWRALVQNDGTEAADANRAEGAEGTPLRIEEIANRRQRRNGISRGDARLRADNAVFIPDGAHKFCTAGFYGTEQSRFACHIGSIAYLRWLYCPLHIDCESRHERSERRVAHDDRAIDLLQYGLAGLQFRLDRVGSRLPARVRREDAADPRCDRQESQSVCNPRRLEQARPDSLWTHGCGPGGRSELGLRPVRRHRAGRQAVRARLRRHEGLYWNRTHSSTKICGGAERESTRRAAALRAEL